MPGITPDDGVFTLLASAYNFTRNTRPGILFPRPDIGSELSNARRGAKAGTAWKSKTERSIKDPEIYAYQLLTPDESVQG